MSHIRTSNSVDHHSTGSSRESDSITDDESSQGSYDSPSQSWGEDYGDLEPSDSASASGEYQHHHDHQRRASVRTASRKHSRTARQQQSIPYRTVQAPPQPAMSTEPSEEYGTYRTRGYPQQGTNGYYAHHAQSHVGGFTPPYGGSRGQVVQYGNYQNPFTSGHAYYNERPAGYDMVPYQNNFFGAGQYGMPMPPYMYNAPPPPPTEAPGQSHTPAPAEKKPDPEVERMKQQLEILQLEKKAKEEEIKQKQLQDQMRQAAELEFERRMERARKEADEQKKELAKAKADAERDARERMEAERKADAEKKAQQEQAIARIEAEARAKFEKERRDEEERVKREAEIAAAAEAALKAKMEAAEAAARAKAAADFKAEIEAKEAAEKKVKEEIEWRKKLEEEAKLKAEIEARSKLEEERKKAEAAKEAEEEKKKEHKALVAKLSEEAKVKLEEEKKKAEKLPIKFKDAVGRKFQFPFNLCQTWAGMEELIKQAFVQVEAIGPHVLEGHYDLIGPNGEIILPSIWEKVVQPDWSVTMHMWPMDKTPPLRNGIPMNGAHMPGFPGGAIPVGGVRGHHPMHGMPHGRGIPVPGRPSMPQPGAGAPRPWAGMMPGMMRPGPGGVRMAVPPNVVNGDPVRHEKKKSSSGKHAGTSFLQFMGGKPPKAGRSNTHASQAEMINEDKNNNTMILRPMNV
ncbi:KAP-like kinetoplast-associated protein [Sporothrix schenckii 1099-18]|uniref:KAP-like kinetoplast-associated protein n=1 Tax=Sporothrix schenckii 1099-18 TaxID=1397361 RepID=A0A0F2M427_SPOSC|nr:KAP-like kinetoplast-associated protein [Sporothrix schenckii 1099-18]KJR84438.1 KAP-like kinetoplast-associated protein [Sporothrix schenckii 1099-18]